MLSVARIVAGGIGVLLCAVPAFAQATGAQKAIVVTGASSGIGRKVTERLAANGFFVYAGARAQKDIDELSAIKNVQGVRLDVTSAADIAAAVALVGKAGRGLYGVVNNAGVVVVAPMIEVEEKDLDFIFQVNMYGPYRITKAFAPMLLESKGRVVNISSLNGIVASPMIGAYSMSKHGIEAFSEALAAELSPFGVRVSLIEPGNYGTNIGRNMLARTDTAAIHGSRFERQWRSTLAALARFENPVRPPTAPAGRLPSEAPSRVAAGRLRACAGAVQTASGARRRSNGRRDSDDTPGRSPFRGRRPSG